jgi:hypothetical protein
MPDAPAPASALVAAAAGAAKQTAAGQAAPGPRPSFKKLDLDSLQTSPIYKHGWIKLYEVRHEVKDGFLTIYSDAECTLCPKDGNGECRLLYSNDAAVYRQQSSKTGVKHNNPGTSAFVSHLSQNHPDEHKQLHKESNRSVRMKEEKETLSSGNQQHQPWSASRAATSLILYIFMLVATLSPIRSFGLNPSTRAFMLFLDPHFNFPGHSTLIACMTFMYSMYIALHAEEVDLDRQWYGGLGFIGGTTDMWTCTVGRAGRKYGNSGSKKRVTNSDVPFRTGNQDGVHHSRHSVHQPALQNGDSDTIHRDSGTLPGCTRETSQRA